MNLPFRAPIVQRFRSASGARWALSIGLVAALAPPLEAAPECGVWVVRNALQSRAAWERALAAVERTGCRRIYLQVSGRWDAYHPSEVLPAPAGRSEEAGWDDPAGRAIAQARARGYEVHAWINALLAWSAPEPPPSSTHVYLSQPGWFVVDERGRSMRDLDRVALDRAGLRGEGWFLDPRRPEVRTRLRRYVLEVATRYPVDGIHLDYIRYPSGWKPAGGEDDIAYMVGLLRDDLAAARPQARLSAAVLPDPDEAARSFGQAWPAWLAEDLVDEVMPMVYRTSPTAVLAEVESYPASIALERIWIGVRLDRLQPSEVRTLGDRLAEWGIAGVVLFSHNLLLEDPGWRELGRPLGG